MARPPKFSTWKLALLSWGLVFACLPSVVNAQAIPDTVLTPGNDPGAILQRSQQAKESEERTQKAPLPPTETRIDINEAPLNGPPPLDDVAFELTAVRVGGVSRFTGEQIMTLLNPYVHQPTNTQILKEIADKITALYRQNGYITSTALLDSVDTATGVARYQVVEGMIEDVKVEGLKHLRESYILKRVEIKPGDVFQVQQLEQDLNKLNNGSLVRLRASIEAGDGYGTSDLKLIATELRPWSVTSAFDNQGKEGLGFYNSTLMLAHNNLLGWGDRLILNGMGSASHWTEGGTQSLSAVYSLPIGTRGGQLTASSAFGHVDIGGAFKDLDITGKSWSWDLTYSRPLWEGRTTSILWDIGIGAQRSLQYIHSLPFPDLGIPNTEVRSLHTALTVVKQDRWGQTILQNTATQGVEVLGGRSAFFKLNTDLTRIQALPKGMLLIGRLSGQLTPDNLPGVQQFQLGGGQNVRGYREGALTGDQGYLASLELRMPPYFLPKKWQKNIQILGFVDFGATGMSDATQLDSTSGTEGNIRSVGFGTRIRLNQWLSVRCDLGFSLTDNENEPTTRLHFGLASTPI